MRQIGNNPQVSAVTLNFSGSTWSGKSQYPRYPALCTGSYFIKERGTVYFAEGCIWTADFDWTLILNGDYKYILSGRDLTITRNLAGQYLDVYQLRRQ